MTTYLDAENVLELVTLRRLTKDGRARHLRLSADLKLAEVAQVVGVAPETIYRWETGSRNPRGEAALRYKRLLDQLTKDDHDLLPEGAA